MGNGIGAAALERSGFAYTCLTLSPTPTRLRTFEIIDFIRYGEPLSRAAGLTFGHSYDNALDEATHAVLQTPHLPHDCRRITRANPPRRKNVCSR